MRVGAAQGRLLSPRRYAGSLFSFPSCVIHQARSRDCPFPRKRHRRTHRERKVREKGVRERKPS